MYRIIKVLNNNSVIAISDDNEETIILAKGVGFGKKVTQRINIPDDANIYVLKKETERGKTIDIINNVGPEFIEIANDIMINTKNTFGNVNKDSMLLLADHIAFAVKRIKTGVVIENPFLADIKIMFEKEYKVAEQSKKIIAMKTGCEINEDELSYITLHIHSALADSTVSQTMTIPITVHECIDMIESNLGIQIDVHSLGYERIMTHIKHMITRVMQGEKVKLDMNDYVIKEFPKEYELAKKVCENCGKQLKKEFDEVEVGYLAIHIARITSENAK